MSAPAARLIYHPRREFGRFGGTAVYFDSTSGNQDPYVWNDVFLHSYYHITQFRAEVGDINLWVSGDHFPEFSSLYCDLVFVVARKCPWTDANHLSRHDPVVDSEEAWADHYRWFPQHRFKRRSRFTLKADPDRSFQAQAGGGDLIDIVPCLREHGIALGNLRVGLRAGAGSQPMTIPVSAGEAVTQALSCSPSILRGPDPAQDAAAPPGAAVSGTGRRQVSGRSHPNERAQRPLRVLIPEAGQAQRDKRKGDYGERETAAHSRELVQLADAARLLR